MTVFVTADTHFNHAGVLAMCGRPFADVAEHNEFLVQAWNSVVGPRDEVWHLGDFAYRCTQDHARRCFDRLNGRKRLIRGNHDALAERLPWCGPILDVAHVHGRVPHGPSSDNGASTVLVNDHAPSPGKRSACRLVHRGPYPGFCWMGITRLVRPSTNDIAPLLRPGLRPAFSVEHAVHVVREEIVAAMRRRPPAP